MICSWRVGKYSIRDEQYLHNGYHFVAIITFSGSAPKRDPHIIPQYFYSLLNVDILKSGYNLMG